MTPGPPARQHRSSPHRRPPEDLRSPRRSREQPLPRPPDFLLALASRLDIAHPTCNRPCAAVSLSGDRDTTRLLAEDGSFTFDRKAEQIEAETRLDGLYVITTRCEEKRLSGPASLVRVYKQLKVAERAFGQIKGPIEIRPIHHRLEERVRAHVFICTLAYYVAFEMRERLAPLLFADEAPQMAADPVAPARRSASAKAKASSATTAEGLAAHSFTDLLAALGTLCRNTVRIGAGGHTYSKLTEATPLQARALELLGVSVRA